MRSCDWIVMAGVAGVALLSAAPAAAQIRVSGGLGLETRGFFARPLHHAQARHAGSFSFQPEFDLTWDRHRQSLTFEPFVRLDAADGERTHFDVRALAWERAWRDWELRIGVRTVFWGVTESQHLVDVVNQTDLVENPDGEDKLGQPMVNLAAVRSWGTIDLFVLPGFRERTFPGSSGRLRVGVPISDDASYVSAAGARHVDWAVRWSHAIGGFDVGAAYFRGTDRTPRFQLEQGSSGAELRPRYDLISQIGVDAQYTTGPWLLKAEGMTRAGREAGRHNALTVGLERTAYQVFGTNADIGWIAEYLYDDRGAEAPTPFQDDVFTGVRLALNDAQSTDVLAGVILDRTDGSSVYQVESNRRFGNSWTLALEARGFLGTESGHFLHDLRRDDYVSLTVTRWF